jgi:hypothetical protein
MLWFYAKWVPTVIAFWAFYGWMSARLNSTKSVATAVILSLLGAIPIWPLVAMHSKRVAVDAMVYDFFMLTSAAFAIIIFSGAKFTMWQWGGVGLCLVGLTMIVKV